MAIKKKLAKRGSKKKKNNNFPNQLASEIR